MNKPMNMMEFIKRQEVKDAVISVGVMYKDLLEAGLTDDQATSLIKNVFLTTTKEK